MAYPSHIARGALRNALRTHPEAETVLHGRKVNDLTLDQLKDALGTLGLSHSQIVLTALHGKAEIDRALAAHRAGEPDCDNLTQDKPIAEAEFEAELKADEAEADAIEAELRTLRSLVGTGGFAALDDRLRQLVTEARKPPVEVRIEVPVDAVPGQPVHVAKRTGKRDSWKSLFGVRGALGRNDTELWDGTHPNTPAVDDRYVWPQPETGTVLAQLSRRRNVLLYGPAGTGKTAFAEQLAARTGRPFALISCDDGTDSATLVGMTVPDASGGVSWQDGSFTRAIRTPGCVVCIDEPSTARAGALIMMNNTLANRQLYIAETGVKVPVAPGVLFIAADNTNGMGGGSKRGYVATNRLNAAFLDRFGVRVLINYLPPDREAGVIVGQTGCTVELAQLLVGAATVTRQAADSQTLSHGIGLRRLLSWAELLTDGVDPETAFQSAVLNCAAEADVEALREQVLLSYDANTVATALNPTQPAAPDPAMTNPTPAGRAAAADFAPVGPTIQIAI